MAHHEESHDDHGHDNTEGSRQYYPKGWYLPLVGLFIVAFGFSYGAGAILGISGTDKWGHKEMCHMEDCKGDCGMDHEKGACCKEGEGECKDSHEGTSAESAVAPNNNDSVAVAAAPASDCTKTDTSKVEPAKAKVEPAQK